MKLHEKWKTRPKVYWCDWVELDTSVSECSITTGNGKRIMTKNDIWLMTNNQNHKWQWIMADEQWKMTNDRFYLFWACSSLSFDNENTKSQMSHLSSFSSICFFSSLLLLVCVPSLITPVCLFSFSNTSSMMYDVFLVPRQLNIFNLIDFWISKL